MMNPFVALMLLIGSIGLLIVVYRVRLNMVLRLSFDNASYQLGMVFASVCVMGAFSTIWLIIWLTS